MKNERVGVDFVAMFQKMFCYCALTVLCYILIRLMQAVFALPQKLKRHQERIQNMLIELQRRFPNLNVTVEDLENVARDMDERYDRDLEDEYDNLAVDADEEDDLIGQ